MSRERLAWNARRTTAQVNGSTVGGMSIGWGFLGAGRFTPRVVEAVAGTPGHRVVRVGARDAARAAGVAERFGASGGTYGDVLADDAVDVIHVTTIHPTHEELALAAVAAGKAVVIEKPLAMSAASARRICDAAREAGVFLAEAMWLRHQPLIREVLDIARSGGIGEIVSVTADFGAYRAYDPTDRLFARELGGGALLDLGVYSAAFAWPFLGRPDVVQATGTLTPQGTDLGAAMQWGYEDGRFAQLGCTFAAPSPGRGLITGTRGWIEVDPHFAKGPTLARVTVDGETRELRAEAHRYVDQVTEVGRCLEAGLLECPHIPHADTIGVLEILDRARAELGVRYPGE